MVCLLYRFLKVTVSVLFVLSFFHTEAETCVGTEPKFYSPKPKLESFNTVSSVLFQNKHVNTQVQLCSAVTLCRTSRKLHLHFGVLGGNDQIWSNEVSMINILNICHQYTENRPKGGLGAGPGGDQVLDQVVSRFWTRWTRSEKLTTERLTILLCRVALAPADLIGPLWCCQSHDWLLNKSSHTASSTCSLILITKWESASISPLFVFFYDSILLLSIDVIVGTKLINWRPLQRRQ